MGRIRLQADVSCKTNCFMPLPTVPASFTVLLAVISVFLSYIWECKDVFLWDNTHRKMLSYVYYKCTCVTYKEQILQNMLNQKDVSEIHFLHYFSK